MTPSREEKKGLPDSMDFLKKAGYKNISSIVYPEMKHEVLNEAANEKVYKDIIGFFNA